MGDDAGAGGAGGAGAPPPPPPQASPPVRAEMADAPPFLSWRAIYLIVLGALAAEIAIGAAVTGLFR